MQQRVFLLSTKPRLDFRRSLVSGLPSPSAGSFPEQRLVIEPTSNHEIKTILQEMKKQLIQLRDDINILKEKKRAVKGTICFFVLRLESCLFLKTFGTNYYQTLIAV